jgi:metallophosphoesterase superfamily enzyme
LQAWRLRWPRLQLGLVRGNHDAHAGDPPASLDMRLHDEPWRVGPWALQHHPQAVPGHHALAGHLHPGVALRGRARDRLRLPCFHFSPCDDGRHTLGVLPAFGGFTGLHLLPRAPQDAVYAVLPGEPASPHASPGRVAAV